MEKISGTKSEISIFKQVISHYDDAKSNLERRIRDFDTKDELFRSYIDESNWPYQSLVFDPRVFTVIFEKTSRLFARKPRGRLVPREGGDSLGAEISNQLLNFQWDDNERVDSQPMLAKWAMMDQNARKYGASFALVKWHYETIPSGKEKKRKVYYDGPTMKVWNNRDVLVDDSYSTIKNWIQLRDYVTLQELESVNDTAKGKPVYKNLDILRRKMEEEESGGDTRSSNWTSKNLSISGLEDQRGRDTTFQNVEIITEYRKERWITFAPKHGVIIRDIPNPYDHQQIPVVMLKYYPIDDDIYGLSEVEPLERLQKAINSLVNQYIDSINMSLYPIVKVRSQGVQMHTLEWGPGKKWIMDDPNDVVAHEQGATGIAEFTSTYRFLVSALQSAAGETSAGISQIIPGQPEKTATEVQDLAIQRNSRDNFNQIYLQEAMKKQMMFWHTMNSQFMFGDEEGKAKILRIIDRDAMKMFEDMGLGSMELSNEAAELLSNPDIASLGIDPEELASEAFPVKTKDGVLPKFSRDESGKLGYLLLEKNDLAGTYDYVMDVASMSIPNDAQLTMARQQLFQITLSPAATQLLAMDGWRVKTKDLLEDTYEYLGLKDASKYFEKVENGTNQTGATGIGGGPQGQGAGIPSGMEGGIGTPPQPEIQQ